MNMTQNSFKFVGGTRVPLGKTRELFRNPVTGGAAIAEKDLLSAASLCRDFAPLCEHVSRIEARLAANGDAGAGWASVLESAVKNGLLMKEQDVTNYILASFAALPERRAIETIAIPTRNRPRMLARLLNSLSAHLRQFGRSVEVCVVDDSESMEMQSANLDAVREWSGDSHLKVRYGNRDTRSGFAAKLAKQSGVPAEVAALAVGGARPFPVSTGAARNSILLETVGRCVLFMDDDVLCSFATIPGSRQRVTFQGDAFSTWFFKSQEEIRSCDFEPLDMIAAHEQLVNIDRRALDPADPRAPRIDISRVSPRFLKAVRRGGARVAVSLTGIVGDSGWDDPFGYFLLGDETIAELTKTEDTYRSAMKNRLILNGPQSICVSDQCTCHSTCMGVDNTSLLPPFTPVMRGQDLMFGSLLVKCVPGALFGAIPAAILHEPGEKRSFGADAAVSRAGTFMTGETLALLARIEPIRGSSSAALMRSLGVHLQELKELSNEDFRSYARSAVEPMLILSLQQMEAAIERHSKTPAFWMKDALAIRAAAIEALNTRNYAAPSDLERAFGPKDGEVYFRQVVEQFGCLLTAWPDLVSAAERLHRKGTDICSITAERGWRQDECSVGVRA